MAFKRVPMPEIKPPVIARERNRAPVILDVPKEAIIATFAMDITILDHERLFEVTHTIGIARGMSKVDIDHRVCVNGNVDVGECLKFLLEEAINALAVSTGAQIGDIDTYVEVPKELQADAVDQE